MTKKLLCIIMFMSATLAFSQKDNFWQKQSLASSSKVKADKANLPKSQVFSLNMNAFKQALIQAPKRENVSRVSSVILSFPNSEGKMERYRIVEASNMSPELEARFPEIKSYAGQGIDDPSAVIRFSVSPLGFQSMRLSANQSATFIEAYTNDLSQYVVYKRADKVATPDDFECLVTDSMSKNIDGDASTLRNADDGILRRYRLAVSATGEYTAYHGGTKALALAAINATMTRVNGVFENDFNATMVLVGNTDSVIYTSTSSDPYGNTTSGYNSQLQSTLTSVIGEANYDIGHLFANLQNNGNAGCIGCVCTNNQKGSGWTSHTVPTGDNFDIDYVAHEMGHQFGGNHTFTFSNEGGTGAQMEPGSGSTIMGYAGITGSTDVQAHSDPYFHARTIEQITNYIKSKSCQTNINTGNAVPTANAGSDYTIPKGTPFVLNGSGTDANSGDVLTYCWEQYNTGTSSTTNPSVNATSGPAFRSFSPTTDTKRYFPRLETIKAGSTSWQWEAVPNVARSMTFRMTVRDNKAGGAANNSDDMVVTVNGTAGPFVVNSPNTNVTWNAGTSQTVTWSVAGTTGNGVNAANVDIFLSTDGGNTYPITLATNTPNDGSHVITVPNNQGNQNRIMVKGSNHIFFDISNTNFTIAGTVVCNATVPTGLAASNVASSSATLSWNSVPGATYDLQYRVAGSSTWTTVAVAGVSTNLTGLSTLTQYQAQVRSKCSGGSNSAYSSPITFTTTDVQLNYCTSASTNVNDEYISRVQLNTINNASGAQFYSNFTNISTTLTKGTQYTITVTPTWTGTVYNEGYSVWIDYNRDGDFADAGEQVWTQAATNATPVSGSFTIPASAVENSTRIRVSMKYNGIPTSCESFTYGEVEDYTVVIQASGPDTTPPSTPTNLVASGTTQTSTNLSWNASTDNVGVTGYDVYQGATVIATVTGTTRSVTGLTPSTAYSFSVRAKDAAGNVSSASNTVNVTTLAPPDTTAPTAPTSLVASGTTQTSTNLSWNASTDNVGVTGYDVYQGATIIATETGTTRQVTGLTPSTAYSFSVRAKDAAGNVSSASNTVNVTTLTPPDTTPPVITLNGSSTINLNVGDTYTEQGATATDNVDGNITANIVITGTVNTSAAGTYLVNYNVSDAAGNAATQVTRTVIVTQPSSGCSGGISSFPYSEGFENTLGAWTQSTADDIDWTVDANGTPSSNTGPSSASQGSYYVYVEASSPNYPSKRAILNSPCFNLSALSSPTFNFMYHMYGASDMGTIALEVSTDNGATWTSIWNESGNKGNAWQSASVNLSAYAGGSIQLRFNRNVGSTWQADIAIDDVSLVDGSTPPPTCNTGNVSLSITFDNYPEETAWTLRNASGTTIDSASYSTANPDGSTVTRTFSGLAPGDYTFIITDSYGDGICCSYGSGSYTLTGSLGTIVSGGSFGSSQATTFCIQSSARGEETEVSNAISDIKLYPNPVRGNILNVVSNFRDVNYEIYNGIGQIVAKGKVINETIDVSKLESAVYQVRFIADGETFTKRFIKQ